MGPRIAAAAVLALIGFLLIIFGVGYLALALATALMPSLGAAGGAAVTGALFVAPAFLWAVIILLLRRPAPKAAAAANGLWLTLFAAVAKETPWIAIVGAGLVAAAEIFLMGRRRK